MEQIQNKMNPLIDLLRTDLSEGRFLHSLGVAQCAVTLAMRFGCDAEQAYLAGLLHDCATKLSEEDMLVLALETGLRTAREISQNPVADYHARLSAVIAQRDYGVNNPEVLQSIAYHQIGGVPMTKLDMIVSLADGIEPSRRGEEIDRIRLIATRDLLGAYTEKCKLYIDNIVRSGNVPSPERMRVYHYMISIRQIHKSTS